MTTPCGDEQAMLIMPSAHDPAAAVVREWLGYALATMPDLVRRQAVLVAQELVANARQHGAAPYVLHLAVHDVRHVLLVAVDDSTPDLGPTWRRPGGLVLVGGLSERWGVERRLSGKTVWAELAFDPARVVEQSPWWRRP
jgi:hypothetical protein